MVLLTILLFPQPASAKDNRPDFELFFPQDPTVTHFTSSFGAARDGHRHQGNDLMAPKLTPVYAAADGVVIRVAKSSKAGRYVVLAHGDLWETWYMHLNNDTPGRNDGKAAMDLTVGPGIEEGAQVWAGQLLAWVGDSGNAEGGSSHTHFELHYKGRAINPYPYLTAAHQRALAAHRRLIVEQRIAAFGFQPPV
jgi:murein DD-endopeptidase MepM/ murein hydrolase activator NlpD